MRSLLPARVPSDTTIGTVSFTELSHIDKIYKSTGVGAARRSELPERLRCAVSGVSWCASSKRVITVIVQHLSGVEGLIDAIECPISRRSG